jgi:hypothetical protein
LTRAKGKKRKPKDSPKAQSERFLQAAREHECELDEATFDETLRKVFPPINMTSLPQGRDKLYWLMDLLMTDHHDVGTFCKEFERTYNFETDRSTLTDSERAAFSALFDKVVVYSPFPDERAIVPGYQTGEQIREAVREAKRLLGR